VTVYAESSAVLAWLFGEPRGEEVRRVLERAGVVVASRLTRVECLRGIFRAQAAGRLGPRDAQTALGAFARASAQWTLIEVAPEVADRAAEPFPVEPVRALDAIHLASVLLVRSVAPDVEVAALDERVRSNAAQLGFDVLPA
jgi:predicted nucleic acid-binding protein